MCARVRSYSHTASTAAFVPLPPPPSVSCCSQPAPTRSPEIRACSKVLRSPKPFLKTQQLAGRRLSRGWYDRGAPASTAAFAPPSVHAAPGLAAPAFPSPFEGLPEPQRALELLRMAASVAARPLAPSTTPFRRPPKPDPSERSPTPSTPPTHPHSNQGSGLTTSSGSLGPSGFVSSRGSEVSRVSGLSGGSGSGGDGGWGRLAQRPFEALMEAAGQVAERVQNSAGALGPLFNPLDFNFRQTAGAGVLFWAGRLYALSQVRPEGRAEGVGRITCTSGARRKCRPVMSTPPCPSSPPVLP